MADNPENSELLFENEKCFPENSESEDEHLEGAEDAERTPWTMDPTPPRQAEEKGKKQKILRRPTLPSKEEVELIKTI